MFKLSEFTELSGVSLEEKDKFEHESTVKSEVITLCISNQGSGTHSLDELKNYVDRYRPPAKLKKKSNFQSLAQTYNAENLPTIWIDVSFPKMDTMRYLADTFYIHPLTIEDCLLGSEEDYQKSEAFEHYRFVSFSEYRVLEKANRSSTVDVHIILPTQVPVIISVHTNPVEYLVPVLDRIASSNTGTREFEIPSAEWVMYLIFDRIVDRFFPIILSCLHEISSLDELALLSQVDEKSDLLRRFGLVRKLVTSLKNQLNRKHDVINSMIAPTSWLSVPESQNITTKLQSSIRKNPKYVFSQHESTNSRQLSLAKVHFFLRDVNDHIVVMQSELEQGKEMLLSLTNTYFTRVSIETSLANNRQNEIMKKFNAMATVVLPLTFIASLWGMNVKVPWQDYEDDYRGFIIITIALIIMSVLIFYGLRKLKWY